MNFIYLIIVIPLLSSFFLSMLGNRFSKNLIASIGLGSIGLTTLLIFYIIRNFLKNNKQTYINTLWTWINNELLYVKFDLILDQLSLTMIGMISGIGLLIHIFSIWYIEYNKNYARFFAYTNLFIASMFILILANNFLFMYLGWEIVGLCSYLLIGFYYKNPVSGISSMKAFFITKFGDIFLIMSIIMIYTIFHTCNFQELTKILELKHQHFGYILPYITIFILIGSISKSAQFPLQTWLSDAMVGPTPVSALIHASTMITVGVYLIIRTKFLFLLTPNILHLIAIIGVFTMLIASFSALVQTDLKRILAYSTMSQLGYMFLALGIQAWSAAIVHLITHAFFKALLFLSSGSLILACGHEKNIFKMGGLWKKLPILYISFLIGGLSLVGFPFITSGFYSKEQILVNIFNSNSYIFPFLVFFSISLTILYTCRMFYYIFHGKNSFKPIIHQRTLLHDIPLFILMFFSTFFGVFFVPILSDFFQEQILFDSYKLYIECISIVVFIFSFLAFYFFVIKKSRYLSYLFDMECFQYVINFVFKGWGCDYLYDVVFVKFYLFVTRLLSIDPVNRIIIIPMLLIKFCNRILLISINGYVRWYIISIIFGFVLIMLCSFKIYY